ncbi:hypothetical protein BST61_g1644 [Cercospora zeina]
MAKLSSSALSVSFTVPESSANQQATCFRLAYHPPPLLGPDDSQLLRTPDRRRATSLHTLARTANSKSALGLGNVHRGYGNMIVTRSGRAAAIREHTFDAGRRVFVGVLPFSQHSSGQAISYEAAEKWQNTARVVAYVANGTHANYKDSGTHDHTIPGVDLPEGPVEDYTDDKGLA